VCSLFIFITTQYRILDVLLNDSNFPRLCFFAFTFLFLINLSIVIVTTWSFSSVGKEVYERPSFMTVNTAICQLLEVLNNRGEPGTIPELALASYPFIMKKKSPFEFLGQSDILQPV
jgi:hypothetical protein